MTGKIDPPEKIDTGWVCRDRDFIRMQIQQEILFQKRADMFQNFLDNGSVGIHDNEVIREPYVLFLLNLVLHILVKFIHENIDQQLRSQIPKRQSLAGDHRIEALDDSSQ